MGKIVDYQKRFTFYMFLHDTKKWRELFKDKTSILSIILALYCTVILYEPLKDNSDYICKTIDPLLLTFSAGLFSLLGVYIAGLSIFMSIITPNTLKNLDKNNSVNLLVGIFFSFYFIGTFALLTIILFIGAYLRTPILILAKMYLNEYIFYSYNKRSIIIYFSECIFIFLLYFIYSCIVGNLYKFFLCEHISRPN